MEMDNSELGLATIRRNRGISLEQIAAATKISLRSLRAIEGADFQKLPGGIYNTSYIKQYAQAIDFDEATLLEFYYRKMGIAKSAPETTAKPRNGGDWPGGLRQARSITGTS